MGPSRPDSTPPQQSWQVKAHGRRKRRSGQRDCSHLEARNKDLVQLRRRCQVLQHVLTHVHDPKAAQLVQPTKLVCRCRVNPQQTIRCSQHLGSASVER